MSTLMTSLLHHTSVIDVFCGAGGLTHGFVKEGFSVVAGIDSDRSCKYAYEQNNNARFIPNPIEDISKDEILALYPQDHIKILVGCAPCQPYSTYTKNHRSKDQKWKLLEQFAELINSTEPDIVSMENVPELEKFKDGLIYKSFVDKLAQKYHVQTHIVYCPDYGIPQKRRRLVFFASKFGPIDIIPPTHTPDTYKSVGETIGHLPPLSAGETDPNDPLHRASGLSELNLRRIQQSKPGGTWRDWEPELIADCHKKATGKGYNSVYGRMTWKDPSPTITTECHAFGSGRFGHPEQDRAISLREAALLQTFPPDYQFIQPDTQWYIAPVARHIGNAVPVELGCVIARSIKYHLESLNDYQQ